jgi:CBS domain-containing protein
MLVHQILKAKGDDGVVTVKPGTLISDVSQILAERRIGGVIV